MQFFWMLVSWLSLSVIIPLTGSFLFYLIDHTSRLSSGTWVFYECDKLEQVFGGLVIDVPYFQVFIPQGQGRCKTVTYCLGITNRPIGDSPFTTQSPFLFNALNSIRSLIITDGEQARTATTLLSQLLRHTLNYEKQRFISVQQEADIVRDYLALEKIRFEERLEFKVDCWSRSIGINGTTQVFCSLWQKMPSNMGSVNWSRVVMYW